MIIEDGAKGWMRAKFVKLSQPSLRFNLDFLMDTTVSITLDILLMFVLTTDDTPIANGPFLLDHGTSMATSTGTSWRVASLA